MVRQIALLVLVMAVGLASSSPPGGEMALANVTRFATGDLFSLLGTDCGPTRCMELSHGTAMAAMGSEGCVCQCRQDTPAFREDHQVCVSEIGECATASFGRGSTKPQIPFVFLPLKRQIIYPSKEIIFTDVPDAICAVTSAQYLSPSGWMSLRDLVDNDVPFSLYRDEGSTFLQYRGSVNLHARLEGRLVAVHVLCTAPQHSRLAASCAAFRIAGASQNNLLDIKSIPFHAGEIVTTEPAAQVQGLSVLEVLAICVCILMLIFIYAAGIIFYVHYKQRQKSKEKDPELNLTSTMLTDYDSSLSSRMNMENVQLKKNPLLGLTSLTNDFLHDAGLSDVSERTEDTIDSSPKNIDKKQHCNVISAVVHARRNKPVRTVAKSPTSTPERISERMQRRSASPDTFERAPHSDLPIIDCTVENSMVTRQPLHNSNEEPALRRKLYFNPVFFETEHLKNPPPAAIEFLVKIREVMCVAKDKMTSKRYIPTLSDIPEEESYHTIDLGWDIPCARRGRRFSAISLKHENSRRAVHCGGCPGCDNSTKIRESVALVRSNSCKSCVSDDYKQRIVQKWLDEVPNLPSTVKPVKSVAKVSGTPRVVDLKTKPDAQAHQKELSQREKPKQPKEISAPELISDTNSLKARKHTFREIPSVSDEANIEQNAETTQTLVMPKKISPVSTCSRSRLIRRKLPPPPPPPICPPEPPKDEETQPVLPEVKVKMEAVIRELNKCRRTEINVKEDLNNKNILPNAPKIIIPVVAADSQYYSDDNMLTVNRKKDVYRNRDCTVDLDSMERNALRRRRYSLACEPEIKENYQQTYDLQTSKERFSSSWRDIKKAVDDFEFTPKPINCQFENKSEIFISTNMDPIYDNLCKPGSLTIQVSGSPVESRRNQNEEFDPDTLDRKPKKVTPNRVEKILLRSAGSFKFRPPEHEKSKTPPEAVFTRKIGSLREIYEAKTVAQDSDMHFYSRRGSVPYRNPDRTEYTRALKTPDLIRQIEGLKDHKPPIPPKQRRGLDLSPKFSNFRESPSSDKRRIAEERDRFPPHSRFDNVNARKSGRRSARARSRRTDLRKIYKTEDSGYMSTDSNDSKCRAKYLMQLRPKLFPEAPSLSKAVAVAPIAQMESDTDDLESLCDGRSESGGESVETDSVFFGNFDDKDMLMELGLSGFEIRSKGISQEQIDSGFMGETNIILSGDSDSEHRSVISIITGRDGRASSASITRIDDPPYIHTVDC